ncbi:hypothetical protein RHGRI_031491 [Rhododendron griersonianum]|uniref:Uncharacterized protein n=1 Tax=Rhododendron griersonianum TaxID=479676 RepID=A0AAV6I8H2_9ERIC|nr:hypothetical protein RHGRI_031491 [Rhododendron griersonianum]
MGFINSSDSWIMKKLIIDYIILTRWTDWMDVCVKIGKVVACLQHSTCFSSFRIIICGATSIRAITCLTIQIRGRILFKQGRMMQEHNEAARIEGAILNSSNHVFNFWSKYPLNFQS